MGKYKPELTTPKKGLIAFAASKLRSDGCKKLPAGCLKRLADKFDVSKSSIKRVCKLYQIHDEESPDDVESRRKRKNCGNKSGLTNDVRDAIKEITQKFADDYLHCSQRDMKKELADQGIHKSLGTINTYLKQMGAQVKTLHVKPSLSDDHKISRANFVLNQRNNNQSHIQPNGNFYFLNMLNTVHVDESWFWVRNVAQKILILPGTVLPDVATVKHKSHIQKMMFLTAMARPQMVEKPNGSKVWFDGKIGMWPCRRIVKAKRSSTNRPAGTDLIEPRSMDSEYYRELVCLPGGLLDKVKEKMPWMHGRPLFIQHDGAKPHNGHGNAEYFDAQGSLDGWNIQFITQPAQSPDLNILDLGFFASLKARVSHLKIGANNLEDLMDRVENAYDDYDRETLDAIWAQLFSVYKCILEVKGGNDYTLPHAGNRKNQKSSWTKVDLLIDIDAYNACVRHIE
jgi:hypothetical protein